jgi:ATP-dependent DNA helicase RecQ
MEKITPSNGATCYTLFQTDEPSDYVPHWIRFQYPHIEFLLHRRRMNRCSDPECPYCKQKELSTRNQLEKWFGYQEFRRFDPRRIPLQQQSSRSQF